MARRPQKVVSLDFVNLSLHDPTFDKRLQSLLKVSATLVTHTDLGMLLPAVLKFYWYDFTDNSVSY
jgi:hypothetical protein